MDAEEERTLLIRLEFDGEDTVARNLSLGVYGANKIPYVKNWLANQLKGRSAALEERKESREIEQLEIARDAASSAKAAAASATAAASSASDANEIARKQFTIAKSQRRIAIAAMISAAVAAIAAIAAAITAYIALYPKK